MSINGHEYTQADLSELFIKNLLDEYDKFGLESTEFQAFEDQVKLFALELKYVDFDIASAHFSRKIPETEELANVQGEAQRTQQLLEKHKQFMHDRQESSDEYRKAADEIESKFQKARVAMKAESKDYAAIRIHEAMKDYVEKKILGLIPKLLWIYKNNDYWMNISAERFAMTFMYPKMYM